MKSLSERLSLWMLAIAALSLVPNGWGPAATPVSTRLEILDCNDGDTCRARNPEGLRLKIRLLGIDAPETAKPKHGKRRAQAGQIYGEEAKRALNARAKGRTLEAEIRGSDVYGRYLAVLFATGPKGRENLNESLVREGFAYAYRGKGTAADIRAWAERAEAQAKREKKGFWGLAAPPEDPSLFRKRSRP